MGIFVNEASETTRLKPLVSVIMNCFNGEKYLRQAVESVINQTYENWELIFWDNQSTDTSAKIVKSFNDARIRYFYAQKHTLLYRARNLAMKEACGSLLAFLDVDDLWKINKIEEQVRQLKEKKADIIFTNYIITNQNGKKKIGWKKAICGQLLPNNLIENYKIVISSVLMKAEIMSNQICFNETYHIIGDFDFFTNKSKNYNIHCINEPLTVIKFHEKNESKKYDLYISELIQWKKINENNYPEMKSISNLIEYLRYLDLLENEKKVTLLKKILKGRLNKNKLIILIKILFPKKFLNFFVLRV